VAGSSSAVEGPATCTRPGSTASVQAAGSRIAVVIRDPDEEELFPAEHPFIQLEPTTLPDDTPHVCATDSTPLFKGNISHVLLHAYAHLSALHRHARPDHALPGFVHNHGDNYIPFITTYNSVRQPVNFFQTILTPDPLVVGICKDSDFVFAKPLHATPEYIFGERPIYVLEDLEILDEGHAQRTMIDCEVAELHDVTVHAKVTRYRALTADLAYLEGRLKELERQWGETSSKKLGCIRCLEMANVLARLVTQRGDILDIEG
jgi:hypothetical protein